MDQDLEKKVAQRLAELPADVRVAVQSADLGKKIQVIGRKHNLHVDQTGNLEDETRLVMLGFADPAEFVDQIVREALVEPARADMIAADIANDIFMPIRESMKRWAETRAQTTPKPVLPIPVPAPSAPAVTPADMMLSQPTAQIAPASPKATQGAAPTPQNYKADPYREPAE